MDLHRRVIVAGIDKRIEEGQIQPSEREELIETVEQLWVGDVKLSAAIDAGILVVRGERVGAV